MVKNYREFLFIINCGTSECFEINVGGGGGWGKGGGCGSYTVLGQFTYPFPNFPHVKWLLNGFFAQQTSLPSVTGFDLLSEYNFLQ